MIKRTAVTVAALLASLVLTTAASADARAHASWRTSHAAAGAPDQVIIWNQELQKVLVAPGAQPASIHPTRTLAITQVAVYDAVAGILGGPTFLVHAHAGRDLSVDAAVAGAARTALDGLLPSQQPEVDSFFQNQLLQIGSGEKVDRGVRFGSQVAEAVLAARAGDGAAAAPPVFTPGVGPGEYQLTPPAFAPAGFTQVAHVKPFVLDSAGQFRPGPPPALTSTRYATDFAEVHSLGRATSTTRTADQTAIGRFWGAAPVWVVWNQIADQAALHFGNSLEQNARVFALLDTTLADSAISLYDAKYTYHRWRPITAITAENQGNSNTVADPAWLPLANTANDPSYPGAHAEFSQAAATVLRDAFGSDAFAFSLTNVATGITRTFGSFSAASQEASDSRIFAGQHFRFDEIAGQELGGRVAAFIVDRAHGHDGDHGGDDDRR
jgi:PAP2 superfamily protein